MTPNVCGIDRVLRVVLVLVLALALILGFIPAGTAMIAGIIVALIMFGTGLFGFYGSTFDAYTESKFNTD